MVNPKSDIIGSINKKDPDGIRPNGTPYTILVVDDSRIMRQIITQILKSEAYDVIGDVENGQLGVDFYKERRPDLVTMDINMPVLSGVEALEQIIKYDPKAKVIMTTSESQKDTVFDCISKGAVGYIVKPPNRDLVLEKIKMVISK